MTARSTAEARRLDPTGITTFRQADVGEYLREVCCEPFPRAFLSEEKEKESVLQLTDYDIARRIHCSLLRNQSTLQLNLNPFASPENNLVGHVR